MGSQVKVIELILEHWVDSLVDNQNYNLDFGTYCIWAST